MTNPSMVPLIPKQSRYVRNTWILAADKSVSFSDGSCVRHFDNKEAFTLSEMIRKRSVFARYSYENDFYIQRIKALSDHSIIEVFRSGDPQEIREEVEEVANLIEKLVLISSTLVIRKDTLLRRLGISLKPRNELDIIIGSQIQYMSSRSQIVSSPEGIHITENFQKRFLRCGFSKLYDYCLSNSDLAERVISSMNWLFESRREPSANASVVKTSIALETLLIFADSETLGRSLSERVAYILSSDPDTRRRIGDMVFQFYKVRSAVVHGNRRRARLIDSRLIEAIDRMCVLLYLIIASNSGSWTSVEQLRRWLELRRWGYDTAYIISPFPKIYLTNALRLYSRD